MKKTFLLLAATCCLVINLNAAKLTNVKYIDNNGKEQTCSEATIVENASKQVYWYAGWYVVNSDVTLSEGAICTGGGFVYLILMDGKTLTVNGKDQGKGYPGIDPGSNTYLVIWGQANQTGALVAHGAGSAAGIGTGGETTTSVGSMYIYGGNITSYGGPNGGSGIGKGDGSVFSFGVIDIKRANVFAAGEGYSAAISVGHVTIATDLVVKADNNNPPTTIIANDGEDLYGKIGAKYVSVTSGTTEIVDVNANVNASRKLMRNGQLLILRDGKTYNALGQEL